jgi:hypothetical protein
LRRVDGFAGSGDATLEACQGGVNAAAELALHSQISSHHYSNHWRTTPPIGSPDKIRPETAQVGLGLNRLAPRRRAEMIAGVTGGKALPEEIAAQIIDRTDGVPLFVEELTKAVVESGLLTDAGDRYTATKPLARLAIPASLQASLLAGLDRLAPVREVASITTSQASSCASDRRSFARSFLSRCATSRITLPAPAFFNAAFLPRFAL